VKQTLAPASNLVLVGYGFYLACERIVAVMPMILLGEYDADLHRRARRGSYFTKRLLAEQKRKGGRILDFTRQAKTNSVILMDEGTLVRSPFHPATIVERIETKRDTGNLVVRRDKGKPRRFGGKSETTA
jgi:regulator of extracellular matrix RemA (YlzA/DUF370 family)